MTWLGLKFSYTLKQLLLLACIVTDLALNTVIDSRSGTVSVLSMMGAQAVVRILSLFVMLAAMWNTFVFKYGLLGALCQRFKFLLLFFPVSFIFLAVVRVMRAAALFDGDDVVKIWDSKTYQGFYVVHNVFSIMYYVALLQASFDLGNPSFYKASSWMQQR